MYELRTIFCTARNLEQYKAEHLQLVKKHCQLTFAKKKKQWVK
jgi:hypothetical protein